MDRLLWLCAGAIIAIVYLKWDVISGAYKNKDNISDAGRVWGGLDALGDLWRRNV